MNLMFSRIFIRRMSQNIAVKINNNTKIAEKSATEIYNKDDTIINNIETKVNLNNMQADFTLQTPNAKITTESTQPKEKKEKPKKKQKEIVEEIVDIRRLDFRIGKIIEINKHSDADTLYVETVDCGEEYPRTVVSGLVNHIAIEELRDKMVMILCNVKPSKMRGVSSEGMLMTAASSEKTEVLVPPKGATPGDLVQCEGFPREPDDELKPKKKIFEKCSVDLKTNDECVVCYKECPLVVPGKGPVVAPTLKGVNVK